jgi:hypothetical protein
MVTRFKSWMTSMVLGDLTLEFLTSSVNRLLVMWLHRVLSFISTSKYMMHKLHYWKPKLAQVFANNYILLHTPVVIQNFGIVLILPPIALCNDKVVLKHKSLKSLTILWEGLWLTLKDLPSHFTNRNGSRGTNNHIYVIVEKTPQ